MGNWRIIENEDWKIPVEYENYTILIDDTDYMKYQDEDIQNDIFCNPAFKESF